MLGFDEGFENLMNAIARQVWNEWETIGNRYLAINLSLIYYPVREKQEVNLKRDFVGLEFSNN